MPDLVPLRPLGGMEQYSSSRNVLHVTGRVINVTRYRLPRPLVESAIQDHVIAGLVQLGQKEHYLRVAIADEDSLKPLFVSVSDLDIADHVSWHKIPGNLAAYEEALFGAHGLIQADVDKNWPLASETTRPPWPMSSGFSFIKLSAQGSARILSACRKHDTTLTALLHTLILKSLLKTVKELQAPNATTRSCTAIDLRRLLPADIPRNTLGDYVAGLTHGFAPSDVTALRDVRTLPATSTTAAGMDRLGEEVWRVSSAIKADINAQISLLPADNAAGLLSWVSDFRARWASKNGEQRGEAWEVSNLGAMEAEVAKHTTESHDATEGFKLEQVVFTQSGMVVGPALGVNVAGIKKGPVCLTITWQRHKDMDDAAEGVVRDLKDWLGQDEES
ncbi:Alcohol acetyltransferase [Ceratocystis platani]|uniref:Alcohol acetyltransferase n=1 Tax=Ceratocystis fimbriata f. sp. platani TaxID=88771 RepID=A0A0F8CPR6_CERFI|nr:Alcohol acetyltransferase [Ceratocystis platani]